MSGGGSPLLDRGSQCFVAMVGETTNAHIDGFSFCLTEALNLGHTVVD